jgi:para-aminobenzoate synthetase/4-amino-4-deoxychorismate lyase
MNTVRFDKLTATGGRSMEFSNPTRIIAAFGVEDVVDAIAEAQEAAAGGSWAVGYVAYEASPALNASLPVKPGAGAGGLGGLPLVWFGIFPGYTEVAPFVGEARLDASPYTASSWIPTMSEHRYHDNVQGVRRRIESGALEQVNYALRLDAAVSGDLEEFYRDLVLSQRGEYGAYLDLGRYRILSASPERFFKIEGSTINVRPMKGSVGRGRWAGEDLVNAEQLRVSDRARDEHQRIVDRMCDELAVISEPGSVVPAALMELQRFETVWQLVSDVNGILRADVRIVDVFRALFPAAAVTGDPKAEAMATIADLEEGPRGVYSGAIGVLAPGGGRCPDASFNVAIRTLVVDTEEGIGEYRVGAGITRASAPRGEYDEAQAKTRILTQRRPEASLYEKIRWDEGNGFHWLERHLERLSGSAAYFGFRYDDGAVRRALDEAVEREQGSLAVRVEADRMGSVSVVIEQRDLAPATWSPNESGDSVLCSVDSDPISSGSIYRFHKTTARGPYVERRESHGAVGEVLMVNERGEVTEGTSRNVAARIAGTWLTPPLACGCMPGVLRGALIDEGVLTEEVIMVGDLESAESIAVLDSVGGWRPARLVDG